MSDGIIEVIVRDEGVQTAVQKKLETLLNDEETRLGINERLWRRIDKYVPKGETGELRRSKEIGPETISWRTPYAHYQYVGIVYGPNFRTVDPETGELAWRSPRGSGTKYPTTRQLGWYNGYTTAGTSSDWVNAMWSNERRGANIEITMYLQRRSKEKGL